MAWIFWKSEPGLWTVGYYAPNTMTIGEPTDYERIPISDHDSFHAAAEQVHYLNGGAREKSDLPRVPLV